MAQSTLDSNVQEQKMNSLSQIERPYLYQERPQHPTFWFPSLCPEWQSCKKWGRKLSHEQCNLTNPLNFLFISVYVWTQQNIKSKEGIKIRDSCQVTYLCFQSFIVLMDFWHGIKRWVVGQKTSIQKASHWSEIGWGSAAGTGSSPHKLFWCWMRQRSWRFENNRTFSDSSG